MSLIIPFFISHLGCPHQCLFCNQRAITGISPDKEMLGRQMDEVLAQWLPRAEGKKTVQFAFYGGSFTCLDWEVQETCLAKLTPHIRAGRIDSVRLSTRPDCISVSNCRKLKSMGVKTIELGVQSMKDEVLIQARRGHLAKDTVQAFEVLKAEGLETGAQLLPGLPGESWHSFYLGIKKLLLIQPDFVRLYPAVVLKKSGLEKMYNRGEYRAFHLNKAVAWCTRAKNIFAEAGIPVIRTGLQHSDSLETEIVDGPYHPAFGELVDSREWLHRVRRILKNVREDQRVEISISPRDLSAFNGMKKSNLKRLDELGFSEKFVVRTDPNIQRGSCRHVICK